jgi:hypothetical protein
MIYAGIGSRATPDEVLAVMAEFARTRKVDDVLRTGGAPGADTAFELAAREARLLVEVFLPWPGFQQRQAEQVALATPSAAAMEIAAKFHPAWPYLKYGARKLHARNVHQVLGADLETPVDLVVCWTPDGSLDGSGNKVGGTGQALRIAVAYDIEILNLARPEHLAILSERFGVSQ